MQPGISLERNQPLTGEPVTPESLGVFRQESILSNETKLVVLEKPNAPVHLRATFFGGARFDPIGKGGMAHLLEHMLLAGTSRFQTKDALAAFIEQYGGDFGARIDGETLKIDSAVADPDDLRVCIDVMHEMLLEPLFDPGTIEMEKEAILRELGERRSNPKGMLWELFPRLFFQGTEIERSMFGTEETMRSITQKDLVHFYQEAIVSSRLSLLACGGTTIDRVTQLAEKDLLVPVGPGVPVTGPLAVNRETPILVENYSGRDHVHLLFGFRTSAQDGNENIALNMIAEVLGGGKASTLYRKLRLDKGLVYGTSADTLEYSDTGVWIVRTSTSRGQLQEVLDIIMDEIKRVSDQGLTPEEIALAQKKMSKGLRMELQTSRKWVNRYTDWERGVGRPFGIAAYTRGMAECTSTQTQAVAQKYFGGDKWYLAMCGDVNENDVKVTL